MEQSVDWWARGIAIAAATLSLVALGWNVYNAAVRDRAKLAIKPRIAMVGWAPDTLACLSVEVSNTGRRPITLSNCTFDCGGGRHVYLMPGSVTKYGHLGALIDETHKMPKRLEEGESHTFLYPIHEIKDADRKAEETGGLTGVFVSDGTGRIRKERFSDALIRWIRGAESSPKSEVTPT